MKIILDAMGGDNAPDAVVEGAFLARKASGVDITLVGREPDVRASIQRASVKYGTAEFGVTDAPEVIDMREDPVTAIREKRGSSMVVGLNMLKNGEGDAFVSAGSTGALLTGATLIVKRVKGIRRAAIAPVLPCRNGNFLVIDAGANVECTPEYLLQFAYMGSYYAEGALGKTNPRVGLLNNGTEDSKGGALQTETYALLSDAKKTGGMNFIGNIEARDPMLGGCDVVVCDGFSGNIFLKASEGAALFVMSELKNVFYKNVLSKLAALFVKKGLTDLKKRADPDAVGGTVMLGIAKPVIKAHGSSNATAIAAAIAQAVTAVNARVSERLEQNMAKIKTESE